MKIFVLGGDGFCGWPVSLALSAKGHDVWIIDNLCRRRIDRELGSQSLTPIRPLDERLRVWREVSGREIGWVNFDIVRDYTALKRLLQLEKPDAIVHLAEQRSVPYSMTSIEHRRATLDGNVGGTHNILAALVETGVDAHLVHLSSIGVYGYETLGYRVPDGHVKVSIQSSQGAAEREILHPANPVSIYHLSKAMDQLVLEYYSKNEGVRISDLLQGTVWGTQTPETALDERLVNRFDYDAVYGTVLNRFILQATLGQPLTVYGSGGQTRAFIHITDTVRCIELALANAPSRGDKMVILNQVAETQRVMDLALLVGRTLGGTKINFLENPREEPESNELQVSNAGFSALGFRAKTLGEELMCETKDIVARYAFRCDKSHIFAAA
ncbi:NAD-dependent epimerase/dehydratase family protein [Hyphomicrobium sp.]|uniref:NAD-dependent epimerase/dehydratase family protein n=1 Tax=Hyphomicrobium sp. TaxID=82 RepID=UPI000FA56CFF|nr:NAD-dependent epimerase/dehydratase family protein [Hyphomicrobium sp.]RUO99114.1 MAG: NAD-dependent epimerase/dehydratase family protein [Hyphomicrobium sp.]